MKFIFQYEAYTTISPLKGKNNHAISKKKQNYEGKQRPGAFACSKCKSIRFHIFPETNKILCIDCGAEIRQEELPWRRSEHKAISTSASQPALTISPFALQKFPFVSIRGRYAAAIQENGKITYTGNITIGDLKASLRWYDIKALASTRNYTFVLKSDGTVAADSNNEYGECDVFSWENVAAITAGPAETYYTLALRNDGTVIATKNTCCSDEIQQWKNIVSIAIGTDHVVGLKSDGGVVANGNDQCNTSSWSDIIDISCTRDITVGLKKDGTIITTGDKNDIKGYEELSSWRDIIAIEGRINRLIGLKADGTVCVSGYKDLSGVRIPDIYKR